MVAISKPSPSWGGGDQRNHNSKPGGVILSQLEEETSSLRVQLFGPCLVCRVRVACFCFQGKTARKLPFVRETYDLDVFLRPV